MVRGDAYAWIEAGVLDLSAAGQTRCEVVVLLEGEVMEGGRGQLGTMLALSSCTVHA